MERRFHYLDTNVLIAIIEPVMPLTDAQAQFLTQLDEGETFAVTSELSLSECLVKPYMDGDQRAADAYFALFEAQPGLAVVAVTREILINAARLRARTRMALPDAIHVSTAAIAECEIFVSDDRRIRMPSGLTVQRWSGMP